MAEQRTVAVLGASDNPERYAYKAIEKLAGKGFAVIPVNPALNEVLGLRVLPSLGAIDAKLDTVTVYLSAQRSTQLAEEILDAQPARVIFNPGAENLVLAKMLDEAGIPWMHACTLVLLATDRF
jgi:predicted CoA-binding protein